MTIRHVAVSLFVCLAALVTFSASASAQTTQWTACASEGGFCAFSGTQQVRYGANGSYFYKTLTGGTACTNQVFGDPVVGIVKQCAIGGSSTSTTNTGSWSVCASEGGFCTFGGTQQVRYGANGSYFYKTLTGGTACTNSVFGDPAVGTVKQCAIGGSSSGTTTSSWSVCASEGGFCGFSGTKDVRYGGSGSYFYKSVSGGTSCTNSVFGDPAPGTLKQCAIGGTAPASTTPTASATPSYGPRSTVTCPAGAVDIWPGSSIQTAVNNHLPGTTYCLRAGVHPVTSSITPKSGDTFIGQYGAILDGTGWSTSDSTAAAFRSQNQNIDYVTIRNLVIRKMPQRGINAFYYMSDHWTIEYNEIASNVTGILFPSYSTIRHNNIHHNTSGGYLGTYANHSTIENNEIAYNGPEQKVGESANVTFRNNFVHHNGRDGIWFDSNNTGGLIEGNRVEDNRQMGIFYEISTDLIIRNNTIRRSGDAAVFISTSKNVQIYNNTLENNFRSITFFVNCSSVGGGSIGFDLANNSAHDNTIVVSTLSGAFATGLSYTLCSSSQATPYLNGSKNLKFSRNTYRVPSPTSVQYWLWNGLKYWNEWQSVGQDLDSVVSQ